MDKLKKKLLDQKATGPNPSGKQDGDLNDATPSDVSTPRKLKRGEPVKWSKEADIDLSTRDKKADSNRYIIG